MAKKAVESPAAPETEKTKVGTVAAKHLRAAQNHAAANPGAVTVESLLARIIALEEKVGK